MTDENPGTPTGNGTPPPPPTPTNAPTAPEPQPEAAQLNLTFSDSTGNSVSFKMKRSMKLGKAMNAFSAKVQRDISQLRFLFEGERLRPEDTPDMKQMEDSDIVDVHMEQIGGTSSFEDWDDWVDFVQEADDELKAVHHAIAKSVLKPTYAQIQRLNQNIINLTAENMDLKIQISEQKRALEHARTLATAQKAGVNGDVLFIKVEGRKWDSRYYRVRFCDPLHRVFDNYARYEGISPEHLVFTSKDKQTVYRGEQTPIEAGWKDLDTVMAFYDP